VTINESHWNTEDEKIKAKESELVRQAAIELLENWKPCLQ
jgi:hypothetical protein